MSRALLHRLCIHSLSRNTERLARHPMMSELARAFAKSFRAQTLPRMLGTEVVPNVRRWSNAVSVGMSTRLHSLHGCTNSSHEHEIIFKNFVGLLLTGTQTAAAQQQPHSPLQSVERLRQRGNDAFQRGSYSRSVDLYQRVSLSRASAGTPRHTLSCFNSKASTAMHCEKPIRERRPNAASKCGTSGATLLKAICAFRRWICCGSMA